MYKRQLLYHSSYLYLEYIIVLICKYLWMQTENAFHSTAISRVHSLTSPLHNPVTGRMLNFAFKFCVVVTHVIKTYVDSLYVRR